MSHSAHEDGDDGADDALGAFLEKFQKNGRQIAEMKHIDAKALAIDYIFPLLKTLTKAIGEEFAQVEERIDEVEDNQISDRIATSIRSAHATIVNLAAFMDAVLLSAGFTENRDDGIGVKTPQFPQDLSPAYDAVRAQVVQTMDVLVQTMSVIEEDDDSPDDDEADDETDQTAEVVRASAMEVVKESMKDSNAKNGGSHATRK